MACRRKTVFLKDAELDPDKDGGCEIEKKVKEMKNQESESAIEIYDRISLF